MADGVKPGRLDACATVVGLILVRISLISLDKPLILLKLKSTGIFVSFSCFVMKRDRETRTREERREERRKRRGLPSEGNSGRLGQKFVSGTRYVFSSTNGINVGN